MRNLHLLFDWHYIEQIIGGDFANFCGVLRIYELYHLVHVLPRHILKIFYYYYNISMKIEKRCIMHFLRNTFTPL